jgi:hypothetical protein
LALGNLKRRGFAITATLILVEEQDYENSVGRLLAEGIRDIRHVRNEAELAAVCNRQVGGGTPYAVATEF